MTKKPAIRPRGYRTCTASLAVSDVSAALKFYEAAFGAVQSASDSATDPQFASMKIGNSMLFVTSGWPASGQLPVLSGTPVATTHHMYVEDLEATQEAALATGALSLSAPADAYWGERCATVSDPFGHVWTLASRIENLSAAEIEDRRSTWLGEAESVDLVAAEEDASVAYPK
ncbi:VOC family protein [uncultured Ruegeria sp.]|uniref:VOC family protein n=1 Tax=uncultured Ruegeria sp. TaxID=259304 RepID=UPI002626D912|nr:VOC family protein [uncultured Ruegeria sp.]